MLSKAKAKLTQNQQKFLRDIFNSYDKNGDDKLNELEIMSAFFAGKVSGMAKGESLKLIKQNSVDGNDTLNFDEFLVWCETTDVFSIDQWKNAFDRWMKKNKGNSEDEEEATRVADEERKKKLENELKKKEKMEKIREKRHAAEKKNCKKIPKGTCTYLRNMKEQGIILDKKSKKQLKCCPVGALVGGGKNTKRRRNKRTSRRKSRRKRKRGSAKHKSRHKSRRKYSRSRKR